MYVKVNIFLCVCVFQCVRMCGVCVCVVCVHAHVCACACVLVVVM